MNVAIRNYLAGSYLLEQEPNLWDAIVVLDSRIDATDFVAKYARRHLYLRFDDILSQTHEKLLPTSYDVLRAIEFSKEANNLLVCCRAGQSRSAALAFVACYRWAGRDAAKGVLNPRRHRPNALVVEHGAKLIDDVFVWQTFQEWLSSTAYAPLSDYYDEIEAEFDKLEAMGAHNRIIQS